jgi:CTD small phosphatase-like protein 2
VRPGAEAFLKQISQYYEIVVFTAALQEYADWVLDQIDPGPTKYIKYRLYRQHALPCATNFVKDLSRLGRDIRKVIIVDNVGENFQLQQENGIMIRSWVDDSNDTALQELAPLLIGKNL